MIHEFVASRFSADNQIFPNKLIIDDQKRLVSVYKKKLIGYDCITLHVRQIASVAVRKNNELLLFSEITIFTSNNRLNINGFTSSDAMAIKNIIESLL